MIDFLMQQGVRASVADHLNQTPLYFAAREGKSALVELLVKQGCPPNHVDCYG